MGSIRESLSFRNDAPAPDDGIPSCTAALRCVAPDCMEMILATWREEEIMAPSVGPLFDAFRAKHREHQGFHEAIPEWSAMPRKIAPDSGSTRFDRVALSQEDVYADPVHEDEPEEQPPVQEAPVARKGDSPTIEEYYG